MTFIIVALIISAAVCFLDVVATSIGAWRMASGNPWLADVGTAHQIALRSGIYGLSFVLCIGFLGLLLK
jgi:hypothetical protein